MYKLNNVSVINAEKIKIGKETFSCNINNKAVVYIAQMSESKKDIKIVFDEYTILKTDVGFNISLISDAIDVVTFNKERQIVKHMDVLEIVANANRYVCGINKKIADQLGKTFIDFAAALEQSDIVLLYNEDAAENFVRRYVAIMRPAICEKAPVVMDRLPIKLIPYLDKLDIVEKVMNETSSANIAYQLETDMFDANISVNTLPLKVLQKLTRAGLTENQINVFESYVRSGKGTIEEIEQMFRWFTAIKKLYEKTTGYNASLNSAFHMAELLQYGFSISEIMIKISNDIMKHSSIVEVTGNDLLDKLADIMAYRKVNNVNDFSMPENILVEHERVSSMYDVDYRCCGERFANAAHNLNKKHSDVIDDIAFICPDHIRDFQRYSDRVNQLSMQNFNDFLDGKIMIFAIGDAYGRIYESPIFFFDKDGNITMIRDKLNDKQLAAAKALWNKIEKRKV